MGATESGTPQAAQNYDRPVICTDSGCRPYFVGPENAESYYFQRLPEKEFQQVFWNLPIQIPTPSQLGIDFSQLNQYLDGLQNWKNISQFFNNAYKKISSKFTIFQNNSFQKAVNFVAQTGKSAYQTYQSIQKAKQYLYQQYGKILDLYYKAQGIWNTFGNLYEDYQKCIEGYSNSFGQGVLHGLKKARYATTYCKYVLNSNAWGILGKTYDKIFGGKNPKEVKEKMEKAQKMAKDTGASAATIATTNQTPQSASMVVQTQYGITQQALTTPFDVPIEPELVAKKLKQLPSEELKDKYKALVATETFRRLYAQMSLQKEKAYAQQIVALKKMVDAVCSQDFQTPIPKCTDNLGGLLSGAGLYGETPQFERVGLGRLISSWGRRIISSVNSLGNMLAQIYMQTSQAQVYAMTQSTCSLQARLALEFNMLRSEIQMIECLRLKIELVRLNLALDQFHSSDTTAQAVMKSLTAAEYNSFQSDYKKLVKSGNEIPRK